MMKKTGHEEPQEAIFAGGVGFTVAQDARKGDQIPN
jgi:hypothetical protein